MVRASASGAGGSGFDPDPRQIKDVTQCTTDVFFLFPLKRNIPVNS